MKPGPKPKPTLTLVGGRTAGKRRPRGHPKPRPGAPTAPAWLSPRRAPSGAAWSPSSTASGLISALDRAVLSLWCQTWAHFREAEEVLAREGPTTLSTRKTPETHPAFQVAWNAASLLRSLASELGLSPVGRMRVEVRPEPDEFDDLFD